MQTHIINAFVDGGAGGNPAGVVLDADGLDAAAKQAMAAQVGLSETAFVGASETAGFRLEFFTPTRQIAHCGHATIATFAYLAAQGRVAEGRTSKETIDGNRDIFIRGDQAFMEQTAPVYTALEPGAAGPDAVRASLGLSVAALRPDADPLVVDTGNRFLMVPLRDEAAVAGLVPDQAAVARISDALDLVGYYVFSTQTRGAGRAAGARMFAPRYGIPEEAATGMAAGPLACYLYDVLGIRRERLLVEQGRLMPVPSPSILTAELTVRDGRITGVLVGGRARLVRTLEIDVPLP